jgi:hypothetical protein
MAQVTRRVPVVEVVLGSQHWGAVDIGAHVTLADVHLRNPATGLLWATTDDPLRGVVLGASPNTVDRTTRLRAHLNGDGLRVANYGPSCALDGAPSVGGATITYPTVEHYDTPETDPLVDAEYYAAGDILVPVDHLGRPCVGGVPRTVVAVTATSLELDDTDELPASCVWLVSAPYDDAAAAQRARHAFVADAAATLGAANAAPYQWGN